MKTKLAMLLLALFVAGTLIFIYSMPQPDDKIVLSIAADHTEKPSIPFAVSQGSTSIVDNKDIEYIDVVELDATSYRLKVVLTSDAGEKFKSSSKNTTGKMVVDLGGAPWSTSHAQEPVFRVIVIDGFKDIRHAETVANGLLGPLSFEPARVLDNIRPK